MILLSLGRVICFTSLSQISPSFTRVRSLCSTSLFRKIRNPQKTDLSPPQSTYKKYDNKCHRIFYGVDGGTTITNVIVFFMVSMAGLEPARIAPHAPQTCAYTNSATSTYFSKFNSNIMCKMSLWRMLCQAQPSQKTIFNRFSAAECHIDIFIYYDVLIFFSISNKIKNKEGLNELYLVFLNCYFYHIWSH